MRLELLLKGYRVDLKPNKCRLSWETTLGAETFAIFAFLAFFAKVSAKAYSKFKLAKLQKILDSRKSFPSNFSKSFSL